MNVWRVPYPKFGQGPGLDRIAAIAARLAIDIAAFGPRGAAIVGSNGKGSTAAMCAALLQQTGATTGLFTSPHLFALNERLRIDGDDISDDELGHHWRRVEGGVEQSGLADKIGGFEFLFLIAADWFAARKCSHTIWEAGIGGRLDPVRLVQARNVGLTSLDLEHTALLGDSLEAIALEKIAAAPDGARLHLSAALPGSSVRGAIDAYCAQHRIAATFAAPLATSLPLNGAHQQSNAALALSLAQSIAPLDHAQVDAGFRAVRWPGRLETLSRDPLVVIDVGHTPEAIGAALAGFQDMAGFRDVKGERDAVLVCGGSQDKDAGAMIARLAPAFRTIVCAAAQHKGVPAAHIAAYAQAANPDAEITLAESVADARRLALAKAGAGAVYVAGGLFLAAEFKAVHLGRDPASLVFF